MRVRFPASRVIFVFLCLPLLVHCSALPETRKEAQEGDAVAQNTLGGMYDNDEGISDYKQALKWYRQAAQEGDAAAQNSLGVMYANGWGVSQDYEQAAKWYRQAAQQGQEIGRASCRERVLDRG